MLDILDNPRAVIGGNSPPEPTPFEAFSAYLGDLQAEARNFLDGEAIVSQAQADAVAKLLTDIRTAARDAESARKTEKKPHDDAGRAVQEKWRPLLSAAETAEASAKAALAPWLAKLEADRLAEAAQARAEAQRVAEAAAAAQRAASATDLTAREEAERLTADAKLAERTATRAEGAKAHAAGGGRAVGMRSRWAAVMTSRRDAVAHYWREQPEAFEPLMRDLAAADVRAGKRTIPGFTVTEERVVV